jgi:hypothetical protein
MKSAMRFCAVLLLLSVQSWVHAAGLWAPSACTVTPVGQGTDVIDVDCGMSVLYNGAASQGFLTIAHTPQEFVNGGRPESLKFSFLGSNNGVMATCTVKPTEYKWAVAKSIFDNLSPETSFKLRIYYGQCYDFPEIVKSSKYQLFW